MNNASEFVYLSKRKLNFVKKKEKRENRFQHKRKSSVVKSRSRSRSRSYSNSPRESRDKRVKKSLEMAPLACNIEDMEESLPSPKFRDYSPSGYKSLIEMNDAELDAFAEDSDEEGDHQLPAFGARAPQKEKHYQEVDTNVVCVRLHEVSKMSELATGDPNKCSNCGVFLSTSSVLEEEKKGEYMWECEFCNYGNKLALEEEERPQSSTISYILQQPEEEKEKETATRVIFCIDKSGSMCCTEEVDKKFKYMESDSWASRLECVKLSIDQQISSISAQEPNTQIGLVLFSNNVEVRGDCSQPPHTIPQALYHHYDQLCDHLHALPPLCSHGLRESSPNLLMALNELEPEGATALGPGLFAATVLAGKGAPGSKVFVCTDGLANVGLGDVEDISQKTESEETYKKIGEYAREKGVSVSLISLVSEECRLDMLSPIANLTGGSILRVQPTHLSHDLTALFSEKVLATNSSLRVQLHRALEFRNEDENNFPDSHDRSLIQRTIGNITSQTLATFEYMLKRPEELEKLEGVDLETLESIPFQSQIYYTQPNGAKCVRVISMNLKITHEKEEAKDKVAENILQQNAIIQSAKLVQMGKFREAQSNAFSWGKMVEEGGLSKYKSNVAPLYSALQDKHVEEEAEEGYWDDFSDGEGIESGAMAVPAMLTKSTATKKKKNKKKDSKPQMSDILCSEANIIQKRFSKM